MNRICTSSSPGTLFNSGLQSPRPPGSGKESPRYRSQKNQCVKVAAALHLMISAGLPVPLEAQEQKIDKPLFKMETLFVSKGDHKEIRLPKIVVANDGTLIAFAGLSRFYRTSKDKGETWSDRQTISPKCEGGNVIVDRVTGDILLLDPGPDVPAWRSKDTAKTWNPEKVVFHQNGPDHGGTMGSEAGITLRHGPHKGRLILPTRFRFKAKKGRSDLAFHYNAVYYSDDRGKTWRESDPVQSGTGEAAVAELSDGSLYLNSRSHMSADDRRRIAWSYDGGKTFVDWSASDELFETSGTRPSFSNSRMPSYGTSAGLTRMPDGSTRHRDVLLFAIANEGLRHRRGSVPKTKNFVEWTKVIVMASFDREETWPFSRHIPHHLGAAYCSLTADKDGVIYVLFETSHRPGRVDNVVFAKFNLAWLKEGNPPHWTDGLTGVRKK